LNIEDGEVEVTLEASFEGINLGLPGRARWPPVQMT
jgi:hypothetical protein